MSILKEHIISNFDGSWDAARQLRSDTKTNDCVRTVHSHQKPRARQYRSTLVLARMPERYALVRSLDIRCQSLYVGLNGPDDLLTCLKSSRLVMMVRRAMASGMRERFV
jgi:hypothetical protein